MDRRSLIKGLVFAATAGAIDPKNLNGILVVPKSDGAILPCDGRALSIKAYPDLFALIGTNYGAGKDEGTFKLPVFNPPINAVPEGEDKGQFEHFFAVIVVSKNPSVPVGTIWFAAMKEADLALIA